MSLIGLLDVVEPATRSFVRHFLADTVMATFHMVLVSSDQSHEPVDGRHSDLDSACRRAFQIAAEAARPGWRTGTAKPVRVNVYRGDAFELSIEVAQDRSAAN